MEEIAVQAIGVCAIATRTHNGSAIVHPVLPGQRRRVGVGEGTRTSEGWRRKGVIQGARDQIGSKGSDRDTEDEQCSIWRGKKASGGGRVT